MVFEKAIVRRISDQCLEDEMQRRNQEKSLLSAQDTEEKSDDADRKAFAVMKRTITSDMRSCTSPQDEYKYMNYVQILLTKLVSADYMLWHLKDPSNSLSPNIGLPTLLDASGRTNICADHTQYVGEAKNIYLLNSPMQPDKLPKIWNRDREYDHLEPSTCLYYPCWNIGLIVNLPNSIADAYTYAKTCPVQSLIYDDWALYDRIHTDGAYWMENGLDAQIDRINDFRIAVLFWLEVEKIKRDREQAQAEMEENKKRFIQK